MIDKQERVAHEKISEIETNIQRYHEKTVKGKKYLYFCENSKWRYIKGGIKNDPRIALEASIKRFQSEAKTIRFKMRLCIIKEMGDHLIIKIPVFMENVQKILPKNVIPVSEMLSVPASSKRPASG